MSDKVSERQRISEVEWTLLSLDQGLARRNGIPLTVPVPKPEFEKLAETGLGAQQLEQWIGDFLSNAPMVKDASWRRRNSDLLSQLEAFVDKMPLWEKAQRLFAERAFEQSLKIWRRITVMCPDDDAAKLNYASALLHQGDHDKAYKQLRRIRDTFEGDADYHVTMAEVQLARDKRDAAVDELATALSHQPDHLPAMDALVELGVLARIYEEPRDPASLTYVRCDSLLSYLKAFWQKEKRPIDFYLEQLGYHQSEGRHEIALEAAERALAADDGAEGAELGRIAALRALGRGDKALSLAMAYAERKPGSVAAQVELALCHQSDGDRDGLSKAIDAALAIDPGDSMALVLKFWPADRKDATLVKEALPALVAYAQTHADVAGVWRSLARAHLVVLAHDEALAHFQTAIKCAPTDDDLRSEWWTELALRGKHQQIVDDASSALGDMALRDWRLRWNEAEAYRALGRNVEARACYAQINGDLALHVDIRKRAKRAAMAL